MENLDKTTQEAIGPPQQLTDDQVSVITTFVNYWSTMENASYGQQFHYTSTPHDEQNVYPAIKQLYDWAIQNLADGEASAYAFKRDRHAIEEDPRLNLRLFARNEANPIGSILNSYQEYHKQEKKKALFGLTITNMTGYQFEEYLREIGILPKGRLVSKS